MKPIVFKIDVDSLEDLTDADLLRLHREYWMFIAKHRVDYKPQVVNKHDKCLAVACNCFFCEYARRKHMVHPEKWKMIKCNFCPGQFSLKHSCVGGVYSKWKGASFGITRWWYARKTANLALKPAVYVEEIRKEIT